MIESVLAGLLKANVATGAAVLLALALRRPVRAQFGARAAYALWIAPLAAGLAVLAARPSGAALIAPIVLRATAAVETVTARAPRPAEDLWPALLALWLAGALAALVLVARRQAAFNAAMGRLEPLGPTGLFRAERAGVGPAVVGVLKPRIVTPADFETRFGPAERELILAHEGAHLRDGDAGVNALACALQCLCWFNPLVHLGVRALRIDQELACDAAVIGRFPHARRTYAELLLKTQLVTQPLPLGCHWPAGSEHPLKERIVMLKSPLPGRAARQLGLGLAVGVGVLSAGLAWAAQPVKPVLVTQPDWASKPVGADIADVYPPEAYKAGIGGAATIACAVAKDGRLANCKVVHEAPAKAGFGDAALKLSERFQMKPMSRDGHPVAGGKVRIPIRFLPGASTPARPS
ncbi:MAG TPA: TonB family protein [Phenylobacterium sp.]